MLLKVLQFMRPRALRERCVRNLVDASNRMDYESVKDLVTSDLVFADVRGESIEGSGVWIREHRRFCEAAGNPQIIIESLDHNGEEVLVRGYLEGGMPEIGGPTMWRIRFRGSKIAFVEVTRQYSQVTLPSFVAGRERREA